MWSNRNTSVSPREGAGVASLLTYFRGVGNLWHKSGTRSEKVQNFWLKESFPFGNIEKLEQGKVRRIHSIFQHLYFSLSPKNTLRKTLFGRTSEPCIMIMSLSNTCSKTRHFCLSDSELIIYNVKYQFQFSSGPLFYEETCKTSEGITKDYFHISM